MHAKRISHDERCFLTFIIQHSDTQHPYKPALPRHVLALDSTFLRLDMLQHRHTEESATKDLSDEDLSIQFKAIHRRRLQDRWFCVEQGHQYCFVKPEADIHISLTDTQIEEWLDELVRWHPLQWA